VNRRPTRPARAAAWLALALTLLPVAAAGTARASGMTTVDYELTSDSGLPAPTSASSGPQVIFSVLPPGAIVPPTNSDGTQGSPLTILDSSSGLDQNQLIVGLKSVPASGNTPAQQLFGLSFLGQGLKPAGDGGKLDFALSVDSALAAPTLTSTTPGIHVAQLQLPAPTPPVTTTTNGSGSSPSTSTPAVTPTANTPEPVSVALWSVMAALGAWRARAYRRHQAA
jgi:hypothetical protein